MDLISEGDDISVKQVIGFGKRVKEDCSKFLNNKSPDANLYRGRDDTKPTVMGRQVSGERVPFSNYKLVNHLHQYMQQSGFKATRLNGYYTTPDPDHASDFGVGVYVVFPIGDYTLTWHETEELPQDLGGDAIAEFVADFVDNDPNHSLYDIAPRGALDNVEIDYQKNIAELFWKMYGDQFRQGTNVDAAVQAGSETILLTKQVHMIRRDIFERYQQELNQIWYR